MRDLIANERGLIGIATTPAMIAAIATAFASGAWLGPLWGMDKLQGALYALSTMICFGGLVISSIGAYAESPGTPNILGLATATGIIFCQLTYLPSEENPMEITLKSALLYGHAPVYASIALYLLRSALAHKLSRKSPEALARIAWL